MNYSLTSTDLNLPALNKELISVHYADARTVINESRDPSDLPRYIATRQLKPEDIYFLIKFGSDLSNEELSDQMGLSLEEAEVEHSLEVTLSFDVSWLGHQTSHAVDATIARKIAEALQDLVPTHEAHKEVESIIAAENLSCKDLDVSPTF